MHMPICSTTLAPEAAIPTVAAAPATADEVAADDDGGDAPSPTTTYRERDAKVATICESGEPRTKTTRNRSGEAPPVNGHAEPASFIKRKVTRRDRFSAERRANANATRRVDLDTLFDASSSSPQRERRNSSPDRSPSERQPSIHAKFSRAEVRRLRGKPSSMRRSSSGSSSGALLGLGRRGASEAFIIDPSCSSLLPIWDHVILVSMLFTAIFTPFDVAFLPPSGACVTPTFVLNRVVDVTFYVDMAVTFRLAFFDEERDRWVRDGRAIALNYLRGFFVIDLVSIVPLWPLGLLNSGQCGGDGGDGGGGGEVARRADSPAELTDTMRMFRLLRLLRLTRLLKASRQLRRLLQDTMMNHFGATFAALKLWQLILLLITFSHWQACAFGAAEAFAFDADSPTWLRAQIADGLSDGSAFESYVAALHFSVGAVTGVGSEVVPVTSGEELLVCCLKLLSGLLWAFLIGQAASIAATLNPHAIAYRNNMDQLTLFMRERKLPQSMRMMVIASDCV